MARVTYAGYPQRVALAVVLDRARTYLLRARAFKQQYEQAKFIGQLIGEDELSRDAMTYRFFAMLNRACAKNMLCEAQYIMIDRRAYVPPGSKGASELDGKNFRMWPQYVYECPPEKDIWSRRNGNA